MKTSMSQYVFPAWVVGLLLVPGVGAAFAQYGLGDGRGLDYNLQMGSGGYNSENTTGSRYRYNNAVITGNVGGLGRFHGNVGYRAPGELMTSTSSDSSFEFRARSVPYQTGEGDRTLILRPGTGAMSGSFSTGGPGQGYQVYRDESRALDVGRQGDFRAQPLGGVPQPAGSDAGRTLNEPEPGRLLEADGRLRREEPLQDLLRPTLPGGEKERNPADPFSSQRGDEAEDSSRRREDEKNPARPGEPGSMALYRQRPRWDDAVSDRQLEQSLLRPPGRDSTRPGEDPYHDLLRRIDRPVAQSEGLLVNPVPRGLGEGEGLTVDPARGHTVGVDELAERIRKIADQAPEPAKEEAPENQRPELASKLNYRLAPMTRLSGTSGTAFDRVMAFGEKYLQQEKYFEADELFSRALLIQPDHPLPRVGRVHAQLGAGLYLAAAYNLRDLFAEHPELIANRYSANLLPGSARIEQIGRELRRMQASGATAEASLLLGYLAYQQDRAGEVVMALGQIKAQKRHDMLLSLLEHIWLKQ